MTQQTNPKRHKHADLIHAWAEGTEIQFLNSQDKWVDVQGYPAWIEDGQYRIKPKLVKKWKWVIKDIRTDALLVTGYYYQSEEEFNSQHLHTGWVTVQKVDSTEIEVEET